MILTLKNFRCYTNETFDLGGSGLTLISGVSGKGKSTILLGINFALFGTGTKLTRVGEKSCSVELKINGIKIVRTKRPNRLLVDDVYEDDAGQSIIDKKFGNNFSITGYISQNSLNSFIMMSPIDKLAFLEKFALEDIDLASKKVECKSLIKSRREDLISITSKLEITQELLEKTEKPEVIKFPKKTKDKDKYEKNEGVRIKNCNKHIKKSKKALKILEREIRDISILEASINQYKEDEKERKKELGCIISSIDNFDKNIQIEFKERQRELETYLANRKYIEAKSRYDKDKNTLKSMKSQEIKEKNESIKNIKSNLWIEYEKDEIDGEIDINKEYLTDMISNENLKKRLRKVNRCILTTEDYNNKKNAISNMEKEIVEMNNVIKNLELQKESYTCPSCEETLRLIDGKLEKLDITLACNKGNKGNIELEQLKIVIKEKRTRIKSYEKEIINHDKKIEEINTLENDIKDISLKYEDIMESSDIKEDIQILEEYKKDSLRNEKKATRLQYEIDNSVFSITIQEFSKRVLRNKKELILLNKDLAENDLEKIDEEELRSEISIMKKQLEVYNSNIRNRDKTLRMLDVINSKIEEKYEEFRHKYKIVTDTETLEKNIEIENQKIKDNEDAIEKHTDNLNKIEKYKIYKQELVKYNKLRDQVINFNKREKLCRDKYTSSQTLLSKILESESIAIGNVIENINSHVQFFTDKFFPEEPISVKLSAYKQSKKVKKPKVNLEIDYKGMQCDVNMLSGGEKSRVILAFTLALGEMFNIPLLMLDESTASLDQDLTTLVFDGIRESFENKIVIVIAHQIITGVFDRIINL